MATAVGARRESEETTAARFPVRRAVITGLLAMGLTGSVIGPALPGLRATFGLTLSEAGLLVTTSAIGYLLSAFLGGLIADRWGGRGVLLGGAAAMAAGVGLLAAAPVWALALVGAGLLGSGTGLVDGPGNALVNTHSGAQRGADLNLAHGFFGAGSVVAPLLAGLLLAAGLGWRWLFGPGLVVSLALIGLVWRLQLGPARLVSGSVSRGALREPLVWVLGLLLCLYVGLELMVGTWAFTHLRLTFDADDAVAGLGTALYWGGLTLGRFAVGTIGTRVGPHALILSNLALSALALGLMVLAPSLLVALGGLTLFGLGLANIFPAVLAIGGAAYPRAVGTVTGTLIGMGGLGGAIFPWLTGVVAERAGLGVALASGLGLLAIILLAELVALHLHRQAGREGLTPSEAPGD
jgi:fucose permease